MQTTLAKIGFESKNYSVHTIRHSFATHLVDNGTGLHTVKELPGHRSLQTTMIYLHLSSKRIARVVNPYDQLPQHKGLVEIPVHIRLPEQFGIDVTGCPCCKQKTLQPVKIFYPWKHADDG